MSHQALAVSIAWKTMAADKLVLGMMTLIYARPGVTVLWVARHM